MMHMNKVGITTPDGGVFRAFALGTCSFGAIQSGRTHIAS
jgi:hypothetical protein